MVKPGVRTPNKWEGEGSPRAENDMLEAASTLAMGDDGWVMLALVGVVAIIAGTLRSVYCTRAREQTRREIAAYIAEGSMSPEQGERLMAAGDPKKDA